jgi:hypothetical protein
MTPDQATMIVGVLVAGTTGWNDDTVLVYVDEIKQHGDYEAMATATRHVVRTWSEARRPPISVVLDAYRAELSRRQPPRPALSSSTRTITAREGIVLARDAYESECRRLGRTPDLARFNRIIERIATRDNST